MATITHCAHCGIAFESSRPKPKFCSKHCMSLAFRQLADKTCPECGIVFRPSRSSATHCSDVCAANARRTHIVRECSCEECGDLFMSDHSRRNRFCSMACYRAYQTRCKCVYNPVCLHCKRDFETHRPDQVYCCASCANSDHSSHLERRVGASLRNAGLIIDSQYQLQGFFYDYVVLSVNLLIEVDGDYWHSFPERKQRDKVKTAIALANGWRIVRVTESELNADWDAAINRILQMAYL